MTFDYFERIRQLIGEVEKQERGAMEKAVECLVQAVEMKNAIFSFGASHAGILTQELYYRAGGLILINPIFGREIMLDTEPVTHTSQMERLVGYGTLLAEKTPFSEGDILIAHSVSGRNPVTIELADAARKKKVSVIAITNLAYSRSVESRHPSKKKLYEFSNIVIDNHGDIGDAACTISGLEQKVSPSSTVIGAAILNAIIAETVQRLVQNGLKRPPIFYSANQDGGDQLNKELYEEYRNVIHYKYN